jgi:hypothetical protein
MKRTLKNLLFLMVALLMVFTASKGMANNFPPQSCTAVVPNGPSYTLTSDPNTPITVSLRCLTGDTNPDCAPYFAYPCDTCPLPYFVYPYTLTSSTGSLSGIARMIELIPVCKDPIHIFAASPLNSQVLPPGTPDSKYKTWPVGIWDNYEIAFTSSPTAPKFWIATNTPARDINSFAIGDSKTLYHCTGGIAGPGCSCGNTVRALLPGNVFEEKHYGPYCIKIERDYETWCAKSLTLCDGTPIPAVDVMVDGQWLVQCGESSGNQRCMECVIFSEASPGCLTVVSGTTVYKIPAGCK